MPGQSLFNMRLSGYRPSVQLQVHLLGKSGSSLFIHHPSVKTDRCEVRPLGIISKSARVCIHRASWRLAPRDDFTLVITPRSDRVRTAVRPHTRPDGFRVFLISRLSRVTLFLRPPSGDSVFGSRPAAQRRAATDHPCDVLAVWPFSWRGAVEQL